MSVNGQSAAGLFFWGSRQGRNRDLSYAPELPYVGATEPEA